MRTLIKNGFVISMDGQIGDIQNCDILIENDRISRIAPNIPQQPDYEIINAANCIVPPGFVDTHRHVWQTPLRGAAANWSLFDYTVFMRSGYSTYFNPHDAYLANYAGSLEALNSGITTVVDHCHLCNSPEHVDNLIKGHQDSGTRAVWCYGFFINPKYCEPDVIESEPGWRYEDAVRVRRDLLSDDDARITFGTNPYEVVSSTKERVLKELELSQQLKANVITMHAGMGFYSAPAGQDWIDMMAKQGLITSNMLFVHCSELTERQICAAAEADAGFSSTPEVDLQMGMGNPVGLRFQERGMRSSIGLDIASNYAVEMFTQMRMLLAHQRNLEHFEVNKRTGKVPGRAHHDVKDVLYLATMGGARAIHKENQIGSLTPGKKADLQIIRTDTVNMMPVVETNPYAAVVQYANVGNIDTVMVDGQTVKKNGILVNVNLHDLNSELTECARRINSGFAKMDHEGNMKMWIAHMGGVTRE